MLADHFGPRQKIPCETINQGLLQPQGELYPIQTILNHRSQDQLPEFRMSFYETISSEFLVQRTFKHTQFSREHWYWRESNWQPLAPKANTVSIELAWWLIRLAESLNFLIYFYDQLPTCGKMTWAIPKTSSWDTWSDIQKDQWLG